MIPQAVRVARIGSYANALRDYIASGNYGAALDVVDRWEQTFPTEPGREYLFSGWLSHNPEIDPALVRRANVYLNNAFFVQLAHGDAKTRRQNMRWRRFSYRFRATSSRTTLKLQDVTVASGTSASYMAVQLCGTVLDGLSVTPVAPSRAGR